MIPYMGGKSHLAGWIINNLPEGYQNKNYCEVFGGGGWVLFKKEQSSLEIYNDLNKTLVNLFRIIRDDFPEFEHRAQWTLHSREMFEEARAKLKDDKFLSDIEKAIHFAVTKAQGFGGNDSSWGYAKSALKRKSGLWTPFVKRLAIINARLKNVQIECLDFERLILKYDSPETVFYLDPPYVDKEFYYNTAGVNFQREDHERLADVLKNIQGKFLLSYYEDRLVRRLYKGFHFTKKQGIKHSQGVTKNSSIKTRQRTIELLISNY